jgi:hypothetical protein
VPTSDEWIGLFTAYARANGNTGYNGTDGSRPDNLDLTGTVNDLMLPLAGYRYVNGSSRSRGSGGQYWSSSPITSSSNAYYLNFYVLGLTPQGGSYRADAYSVRCFKNSIAPSVSSVLYTPATWTSGSVTVTVTLDQEAGSVDGWTSNGTTFTKTYSTNTTENVTFKSALGKTVSTGIIVSNIDKTAPTLSWSAPSTTITKSGTDVTYTLTLTESNQSDTAITTDDFSVGGTAAGSARVTNVTKN